ncbi:glycosyl hydrolase 115 family protein [Burkholderiaceae bacterium UC74_6]
MGGPRNYKWLNVTPLPKIWEQMRLATEAGANRMWIVNVGDLKPMEVPTEFFLSMAWHPQAWTAERMDGYLRQWATREFGPEHAGEIAEMVALYAKYNGRRKPELLQPDTYSLTNYREAETIVRDWRALSARAQALESKLPRDQRDAFFQFVLHPIEACAIVGELYYTVGLNRLYAKQGRAQANAMARRARELFAADAAWTRRYNEELAGGKWRHFMDQTHLGYTYWQEPPVNVMPAVSEVQPKAGADMGVAVEGSESGFTLRAVAELAAADQQARRIEVFNRGAQPFDFKVQANLPAVRIEPASGRVEAQQDLSVSVDWAALPAGTTQAVIVIEGAGRSQRVVLPLERRSRDGVKGFVETNGVIAIEAGHFDHAVAAPGREWLRIPDHGRTLSGMSTATLAAAASARPEMHLAYDVHLFKAGIVKVVATLAPTQNFSPDINGGRGLRYAVSFDDEPPQIVNLNADASAAAWDRSVEDESVQQTTQHQLAKPGAHVLKFWAIDPGVVLNKLVIDAGGLQPSYLGPPESTRIGAQ